MQHTSLEHRLELIVVEAALTGSTSPGAIEKTIEARKASFAAEKTQREADQSREQLVLNLRVLRRRWGHWADSFSLFLDRIYDIYARGASSLRELALPPDELAAAERELEQIIGRAITEAAALEGCES